MFENIILRSESLRSSGYESDIAICRPSAPRTMQDKVLTCKKVLQTKQSLGSCGNMSEVKCPVGPHVREGHRKTAYPIFTFIYFTVRLYKQTIQTLQKTTLPLPFRASLDAVGVCWSPYHKLFQLRALDTFEAATEILQFPGLDGQNATECQVYAGAHHFCAVAGGWDYIGSSLIATQFSIYCQALQALQRRQSFTCKQAAQYHRTSES